MPRFLASTILAVLAAGGAAIAGGQTWGDWPAWGDQRDGTYRNPVLPADFSDLDAIGVGGDYYAISSTLHISPGMAVLHSVDLVNWRIVGHVVDDLRRLGPGYGWDEMQRYGRGVWAGSIRHHAGLFYVVFGTPDDGLFVSTASRAEGPWSPPHALLRGAGWDDPSLLWDDAGRAWFVATHFADGYKTYLFRVSPDVRVLDRASARLIHQGAGREASKLLYHDGYHYLVFSEYREGVGRYVMASRSRSPAGPYGEERVLAVPGMEAREPNQGGLIEGPDRRWYFFTHHGTGDWEGRAASLLPVAWRDGWPVPGAVTADGRGSMVAGGTMPRRGARRASRRFVDHFSTSRLAPEWGWNHQPRAERWSLAERPGFLRLRAWTAGSRGEFRSTGNVVSVRTYRTERSDVVARIDLRGMADGQFAGLVHFSRAATALGVVQKGGRRFVASRQEGMQRLGPALSGNMLWLRSTFGREGRMHLAYSSDGRRFTRFGPVHTAQFAQYRGDRVGLMTVNDRADAGYIDIDSFTYAFD